VKGRVRAQVGGEGGRRPAGAPQQQPHKAQKTTGRGTREEDGEGTDATTTTMSRKTRGGGQVTTSGALARGLGAHDRRGCDTNEAAVGGTCSTGHAEGGSPAEVRARAQPHPLKIAAGQGGSRL